jgi:hypothetical protein
MYSIYYKQKEYEVPQILFLQVGICLIEFKKAKIIDKPFFINMFREKYIPKILASPDFDYSKLKDEELKGVIDTTSITNAY